MDIVGFDHIVISAVEVSSTVQFYRDVLGMDAREIRPGKWDLHFGTSKISLQDAASLPEIARNTSPGTANFCVFTDMDIEDVITTLRDHDVNILTGPSERVGACGKIMSVYFNDPDGNLVEVCNRLEN